MSSMSRMSDDFLCREPGRPQPTWPGQAHQQTAGQGQAEPAPPGEPGMPREQLRGLVEQVESQLKRWLALAARLGDELEQPEPDEGTIATLLAERGKLQQRLLQLAQAAPAEVWSGEQRLRELAEAIVATDRDTMERARAIRAESLRKLAEIQKRREMAAGYRRALKGAVVTSPILYDKQV